MVLLGRIVAPFGIKGWIKIQPLGDDPLAWAEMPEWWLSRSDDAPPSEWTAYKLISLRPQGNALVASIEGCIDRNGAEALKGCYIGAPREALPETDEDEFYWSDLTGLTVVNTGNETLGEVAGLMSTGAHDVLQVVEGKTERLIPFVKAYVVDVDLEQRTIRVEWQKDW